MEKIKYLDHKKLTKLMENFTYHQFESLRERYNAHLDESPMIDIRDYRFKISTLFFRAFPEYYWEEFLEWIEENFDYLKSIDEDYES